VLVRKSDAVRELEGDFGDFLAIGGRGANPVFLR
jgi:hypothetical protein